MKATAVVEGGVLEDQATEVTVGSHDVLGLFLLAHYVAIDLVLHSTYSSPQGIAESGLLVHLSGCPTCG